MKKNRILFFILVAAGGFAVLQSCSNKRSPGRTYMPDMQYSRAYEAYAANNLNKEGINYIPEPVEGTIRRGDLYPYNIPNTEEGYAQSASVKNPLPLPLSDDQMKEAERLYHVYCGICHGAKMDAQGPLSTGGKVPAVANLTTKVYVDMPEGTMFHSITYGKGNMGSYASQLTREERWMVVEYVKRTQLGDASQTAPTTDNN
ncbi:MAG: cytochrome c [Chitinophagaceae bacterium]|nr:cytochrome c [Chitinophagaceae bacterium]